MIFFFPEIFCWLDAGIERKVVKHIRGYRLEGEYDKDGG